MAEPAPTIIDLIKKERFYVLFGLLALVTLSWWYLLAWDMPMSMNIWTLENYTVMFLMWAIMMVAMMVPSALPMILFYNMTARKSKRDGGNLAPLWVFLSGYILVWTGFSAAAALLQLGLQEAGVVNMMIEGTHPWLLGGLLILAGAYQVSPWKDTCLRFCQHPVMFITKHWRRGTFGALKMGLIHGGYCVGCCWALMILLFVGGVMNLLWVAILAIFVLLEKVIPGLAKAQLYSGIALILAGLYVGFAGGF